MNTSYNPQKRQNSPEAGSFNLMNENTVQRLFQEATMKITRIDPSQAKPDPSMANYFEGEVRFQPLVRSADSDGVDLLHVHFRPGARTIPHIHHQDQVLQITDGQGIIADESEKHLVSAGDVISIPKGTWHWHGAARETAMSHISIMKRGQTDWTVDQKNWATGYGE
jgi:quercetin dioxygenase-like cupin family protein